MKIGEKHGCYIKDRIDLYLSPVDLERLILLTEEKALEAREYESQGGWRELKDKLQKEEDRWREARDAKDRDEL